MEMHERFYKDLLDNLYEGVYFADRERKIIYWNRGAERITGYSTGEVVGHHCFDNILFHVDEAGNVLCRGGCPLLWTIMEGKERESEIYLHHKDGHRVPVRVRTSPIRNERGDIIGAVEMFGDNSHALSLRQRVKDLHGLAMLDPLTGLANRRFAESAIHSRLDEYRRHNWPFGVMFLDIDHFKKVNDDFGHEVGDRVLKMISKTLLNSCRSYDIIGRWGGEEFVALAGHVDLTQLRALAEKFRALVSQSSLTLPEDVLKVTISIGATLALHDDTVESIVRRADELMYESKAKGRNRVSVFTS